MTGYGEPKCQACGGIVRIGQPYCGMSSCPGTRMIQRQRELQMYSYLRKKLFYSSVPANKGSKCKKVGHNLRHIGNRGSLRFERCADCGYTTSFLIKQLHQKMNEYDQAHYRDWIQPFQTAEWNTAYGHKKKF